MGGEEALIKNGLPVTVLRGNFFMNHLLKTETDNIDNEGWFTNPLGDTRNSFVCTNDLGEIAAKCIVEGPEKHADKFYDITGPEPQSMYEIAEDLGNVLGKKLEYRPQDMVSSRRISALRGQSSLSTSATDSTLGAVLIFIMLWGNGQRSILSI